MNPAPITELNSTDSKPIRRPRVFAWVAAIFAGAILALIVGGVALVWYSGIELKKLGSLFHEGRLQITIDQPTVVRQIQQLQRLETVSYTMDKILGGERDYEYLPKFLAGDRLLLVVHGEVIAGVNLGKLQPNDVSIHGQDVAIHLPSAEIFSTRIDNAKTRVYSRDTGIFTTPDPNLESEVRQEAERQLQAAALQDGILKAADANAHQTVSNILTGLGFTHVDVQ